MSGLQSGGETVRTNTVAALLALFAGYCHAQKGLELGACNDGTAKAAVVEVLQNAVYAELEGHELYESAKAGFASRGLKVTVEAVRTVRGRIPGQAGLNECEASLRVQAPAAVVAKLLGRPSDQAAARTMGLRVDATSISGPVSYSSQPTDDGNEVYVKVNKPQGPSIWPVMILGAAASLVGAPVGDRRPAQ